MNTKYCIFRGRVLLACKYISLFPFEYCGAIPFKFAFCPRILSIINAVIIIKYNRGKLWGDVGRGGAEG